LKFIPNTLLARFLILIATVLIIAQVVSIRIFDYFERGPRAEAVAQEIETVINFTRASLISSREDKRLTLLSELSSKGDIRIYPAYYFEDIEPLSPDPFLKVVAGKIKERLGENTLVITNHYGIPGLWVSFSITVIWRTKHFITYGGGPEGGYVYFYRERERGWYKWERGWFQEPTYTKVDGQVAIWFDDGVERIAVVPHDYEPDEDEDIIICSDEWSEMISDDVDV